MKKELEEQGSDNFQWADPDDYSTITTSDLSSWTSMPNVDATQKTEEPTGESTTTKATSPKK